MTPDARRHYRELLAGFNLEAMGDDEAGQFLADLCEKTPAGVPLRRVVRLAMALLEDRELDEERASACEQDMCGLCSGCVERARYAFERGERQCYCCDFHNGVHGWREADGETCQYAETYSEEERARHMAIGLDRIGSEGTTT